MQTSAISNHSPLQVLQSLLGGTATSSLSTGQIFPSDSATSGAAATAQGSSPASQFSSDVLSALISYQANPVEAASSAASAVGDAASAASDAVKTAASDVNSLLQSLQGGHHHHHHQVDTASTTDATTTAGSTASADATSTGAAVTVSV